LSGSVGPLCTHTHTHTHTHMHTRSLQEPLSIGGASMDLGGQSMDLRGTSGGLSPTDRSVKSDDLDHLFGNADYAETAEWQ
jgi:hypothetical protein